MKLGHRLLLSKPELDWMKESFMSHDAASSAFRLDINKRPNTMPSSHTGSRTVEVKSGRLPEDRSNFSSRLGF